MQNLHCEISLYRQEQSDSRICSFLSAYRREVVDVGGDGKSIRVDDVVDEGELSVPSTAEFKDTELLRAWNFEARFLDFFWSH